MDRVFKKVQWTKITRSTILFGRTNYNRLIRLQMYSVGLAGITTIEGDDDDDDEERWRDEG